MPRGATVAARMEDQRLPARGELPGQVVLSRGEDVDDCDIGGELPEGSAEVATAGPVRGRLRFSGVAPMTPVRCVTHSHAVMSAR